jgi:D-glycerate 3-kinase
MIESNPAIALSIIGHLIDSELIPQSYKILNSELLKDRTACQIFNVTSQNIEFILEKRSQILKAILPEIDQEAQQSHIQINNLLETLWHVWIPLAVQLGDRYQGTAIIQGILGGQGTGKTTMTKFLKIILKYLGYECVNLSLDDLYKTYSEREEIKKLDPQIHWRGVPSTHDIQLGLDTLEHLRCELPFGKTSWEIPQFDKSLHSGAGDRIDSKKIFTKPQIILFEGWFVGVCPVDPVLIHQQVPESDCQFVLKMNAKLEDYLSLWQKLDRLWMLLPQDYRFSLKWRKQAERKMITGMSDREIEEFVHYFWRSLPPEIFITPMRQFADLVIEIDFNHQVINLQTTST